MLEKKSLANKLRITVKHSDDLYRRNLNFLGGLINCMPNRPVGEKM